MSDTVQLEKIVNLAKRRGFIFPGSDIYGGLANSWDYGPLGVELKNNVKHFWWQRFVHGRLDVVGIDAAILMNPKVWEASGHVETFHDPLVEDKVTHKRYRADHLLREAGVDPTGLSLEKMAQHISERGITSPEGNELTKPQAFNLMFKTYQGATEDTASLVYLRPETAQAMFVDFPLVAATSRRRVPFGIAQSGKAFRNEITPGNFIFRTREFEQMEIEYFVHPDSWEKYFAMWLEEMHHWITFCGINTAAIHEAQVPAEQRAHYSQRTVDIEFDFPFGRDELYGLAYRGDFDLRSHAKYSKKNLNYTDPQTGETYLPHVIEPTFGVDRTVLAMMLSAYTEEEVGGEQRVVLKFPPRLAPYQAAVLPLSRKEELRQVAEPLAKQLSSQLHVDYDETQSIGRRYRRQDEIGTPYCITVDFDTLQDKAVTIRDRDSMTQERVPMTKVETVLLSHLTK